MSVTVMATPRMLCSLLLDCQRDADLLSQQASERSEKLESDATAMEGQYASAYAGARQTYSQGRARLDAIQAVRPSHYPITYLLDRLML